MSDRKSVIFCHGALADNYEKQANAQGYTFGTKAEQMQKVGFGLVFAHINGIITGSEYDRILRRFSCFLAKELNQMKEADKEEQSNECKRSN